MHATSATTGFATSRQVARGAVARVVAGLAVAMEHANARRAYRRLLESDEIMRDVGITRDDVRNALMESGGRL